MSHLETYTARLKKRGLTAMAASVEKTALAFCRGFLDHFDYCSESSALLVGNVQSGKTGQMFGIISAAADRDFFVFVILTTDNVLLQQQTLARVAKDLQGFCVCGENDSVAFEQNNGIAPTVVVLKKNSSTLRRWKKTFLTSRVLEGNPLFILDDEADATSLNTKVNQDEVSAINRHLAEIRANASASIYLEVTGTPQSIFLQTEESGWAPQYVQTFTPGKGYIGGDFFFPEQGPVPRSIGFIDDDPHPIRTFALRHLLTSAVSLSRGASVSNALAHVSAFTADHHQVKEELEEELHALAQHSSQFPELFASELNELRRASLLTCDEKRLFGLIKDGLLPTLRIVVKNSQSDDDADFSAGCNFIIGGNSLGRGVTIPRLNTVLYTRLSKNPQADTIWQHNRIFGYDRDPKLIKIFLPRHLWKLLADINAENRSIYDQIAAGIDKVKISFPAGISPTRRNVLDAKRLHFIQGGTNSYPDDLTNKTIADLDTLLQDFGQHEFNEVPAAFVQQILSHIVSADDSFSPKEYDGIFAEMLSSDPDAKAVLIVRRSRDVAQGTGALISPNDWELAKRFPSLPVVTLYKVTGRKGWHGEQLWVPNIRLPLSRVYFAVR